MPVVHPAEVWKDSGRYDKIGPELVRFKDRGDRDMVLAMTHEEVVALLLRDIVQSYRQLPVQLYHFQTKFRDEPRSRGGLIRVREFVMKDAYSCDLDDAGLDVSYRQQYGAYEADLQAPRARRDRRRRRRRDHGRVRGPRVHGPQRLRRGHPGPVRRLRIRREPADRRGREALAGGRGRPARWRTSRPPTRRPSMPWPRSSGSRGARTAKATFFVTGDGRFVVAIVRGDYDVNETKLVNAIKATGGLRPAQVEEIKARGMEPGLRLADRGHATRSSWSTSSSPRSPNLVAGANRRRMARAQRQRPARLHAGRRSRRSRTPARATPASDAGRR